MATIFVDRPGSIVEIPDPAAQAIISSSPAGITFSDWLGFGGTHCLITGLGIEQSCNVQFMQTLGRDTFVYTFGNKVGDLAIEGLAFAASCNNDQVGIDAVFDYYRQNRVTARADLISVAIGSSAFSAVLVGMAGKVIDTATDLFGWTMLMKLVPEEDLPPRS